MKRAAAAPARASAVGPLATTNEAARAQEDRWQVPTYAKWPVALAKGLGSYVYDVEGRRYLDLYGGHCVALAGHCHPRLVEAIREQAGRLIFYSNVLYCDVRALAAERLASLAPEGLRRVFLCNCGTEANETALKIARKHTGRMQVVSLRDGFHGRTLGSLGATGLPKYHDPAYPIPSQHTYIPYGDLEAATKAVGAGVACVILEPIPSLGGIRVADAAYFRGLRELCTRTGTLLIFDEVQTGFGRTGRLFFGENVGVTPDLITGAKGVAGGFPAAVVFVREDLAAKMGLGEQGTTFGGGPLACAAIAATADVIRAQDLPGNARRVGDALAERLREVPGVKSVTGLGLIRGVNLERPAQPIVKALFEQAILTGTCEGDAQQIRLLPPLTLTLDEAQPLVETLARLLA